VPSDGGLCDPLLVGTVTMEVRGSLVANVANTPNDFCFGIDSTNLVHPYLLATTDPIVGDRSYFSISAHDVTGKMLATGGDIVVGTTMPMAHAQVEWTGDRERANIYVSLGWTGGDEPHTTTLHLVLGDAFE
jgi:hypothetical protein